ncbi:MAG TPA: glucokinase, partial [Armatimonadetes bacterium]|nr:glucokinase [Armatimonadota bacterium]
MAGDEQRFVGVDVGGTKILALVVSASGEVIARKKRTTDNDGPPMVEQISRAIDAALESDSVSVDQVSGIGVAMPGAVDSTTGYLGSVPNLKVDDHRLVDRLR